MESPDSAFATGFDVASPELPVLPERATGFAVELPEVAEPLTEEPELAFPELPPLPEFPDVTFGFELADPEFPELPLLPELPDCAPSTPSSQLRKSLTVAVCDAERHWQAFGLLLPITAALPVLPVSPVSVFPELTVGLELAAPVPPEEPPEPVSAAEVELGFDVAEPVSPAVPVAFAVELPVAPEVAVPFALAMALPEPPDVAVDVVAPVLPELTLTLELPVAEPMPNAGPELPECATETALESPELAFACGLDVALPELPLFPEMATGADVELPEVADPEAYEEDVALPLVPPLPESPDVTVGLEVAFPELPESPLLPESPDAAAATEPPLGVGLPTGVRVWAVAVGEPEPLLMAEAPPVLPVPPVSVLPEPTDGLEPAAPVPPEPPPPPEVAVDAEAGLDVAGPVVPEVPVAAAPEFPVPPDEALPVDVLVVVPVLPPLAVDVVPPEFPDWADAVASPRREKEMDPAGPDVPEPVSPFQLPMLQFAAAWPCAASAMAADGPTY